MGVATAERVPLQSGRAMSVGLEPQGYDIGPDEEVAADDNVVSPGYFVAWSGWSFATVCSCRSSDSCPG